MRPGWYLRRLSRMGPAEVAGRAGDMLRKRAWQDSHARARWCPERQFAPRLPPGALHGLPEAGVRRLIGTADRLMDGRAEYFGVARYDMVAPDWSQDPRTGRRAPTETYAFGIPYRDEQAIGDIKQIWEPSRHQHLTVLAAAHAVTGEERYAQRVADHLKSWWAANPPLRGVHWISGIELGIRLTSWVWVRRLLAGWPGAAGLFEDNPEALTQIWHHQRWLSAFRSRGSSANNHVIAETSGQLAAACAFGWFPESRRWRTAALASLVEQLRRNTFDSGLNRELATEYHGLVLELGLAALIEADVAGLAVPAATWSLLRAMTDALAAVLDATGRPPRQGDADDGHGVIVDGAGTDRWASLLATGDALFGRLGWWPSVGCDDLRTPLLVSLLGRQPTVAGTRPAARPDHLADAGMTILRTPTRDGLPEIWCRCDGGPHGYLAIAAHAHADALSVEVRHDGVDILADPGTYCYHGEPGWRGYFRSTLAHNTLQLDDRDQSSSGGPFLWTRHARTRLLAAPRPGGESLRWSAEHHGYAPAVHRRSAMLHAARRELVITDEVLGGADSSVRLVFHLGPWVNVEITDSTASLSWADAGSTHTAELALPGQLRWSMQRGQTDPPLGWYSAGFGRREPASTLFGAGVVDDTATLTTVLRFHS
ncbi:MAG: alginate lyase family protein [Sciscionella sp.]